MNVHTLEIISLILIMICGLCAGSFVTALIHRLPRGIPWIYESRTGKASRSACPSCHTVLTAPDLVPVFSWLMMRGKCRHCGYKISPSYPLIELSCMLLVTAMYLAWPQNLTALPVILAVPFLLTATFIDWEHMILPDDLNIILGLLSVVFTGLLWFYGGRDVDIVIDHFLAGLALVSIFFVVSWGVGRWKGKAALGMGDLKFLGPAGLFLGLAPLPTYLMLSGLLGLVSALLKGKIEKGAAFPFGPALIISLYIHLFLTGLGFDYTW